MTEEKLTELNALKKTIEEIKHDILEFETHDYISIYGENHNDTERDWILTSNDEGLAGLKDYILDFLNKRLEEAEKLFEEA